MRYVKVTQFPFAKHGIPFDENSDPDVYVTFLMEALNDLTDLIGQSATQCNNCNLALRKRPVYFSQFENQSTVVFPESPSAKLIINFFDQDETKADLMASFAIDLAAIERAAQGKGPFENFSVPFQQGDWQFELVMRAQEAGQTFTSQMFTQRLNDKTAPHSLPQFAASF